MPESGERGLYLRLFGPFEARLDGVPLGSLRLRLGEPLLAFLALHHGHDVRDDLLIETFWLGATDAGDEEERAHGKLRKALSLLREALGPEGRRVEAANHTVFLDLEDTCVDVMRFDAALGQGLDETLDAEELLARTGGDLARIKAAVARYRGPLLQGWREEWVLRERETRHQRYLVALEALALSARRQGAPGAAARYLRRLVQAHPARESFWADLMDALVQSGERVEACEVYRRYGEYLHRKGLAPAPGLAALCDRLQEQPAAQAPGLPPDYREVEPVGGAVPLSSLFYVRRPEDTLFHAALARGDSIVLVKGPRQIGKTSLLARGLEQARSRGARVLFSDLATLGAAEMETADTFFHALARGIAGQMEMEGALAETWGLPLSPNGRFERFLRQQVLGKADMPVVWGIDEADRLFPCGYRGDVFGLFRSWHNARSVMPDAPWERLTIALAYSTEAHLYVADLNQSPFNVGTRVLLEDLTREQVADLNRRYDQPLRDDAEETRFAALVGGHPFLVRRGLQWMKTEGRGLAAFEACARREDGLYGDHLDRMLVALQQDPDLLAVVIGLLQGRSTLAAESFFRLRAAGVLAGETPGETRFRCRLYALHLAGHLL